MYLRGGFLQMGLFEGWFPANIDLRGGFLQMDPFKGWFSAISPIFFFYKINHLLTIYD